MNINHYQTKQNNKNHIESDISPPLLVFCYVVTHQHRKNDQVTIKPLMKVYDADKAVCRGILMKLCY